MAVVGLRTIDIVRHSEIMYGHAWIVALPGGEPWYLHIGGIEEAQKLVEKLNNSVGVVLTDKLPRYD